MNPDIDRMQPLEINSPNVSDRRMLDVTVGAPSPEMAKSRERTPVFNQLSAALPSIPNPIPPSSNFIPSLPIQQQADLGATVNSTTVQDNTTIEKEYVAKAKAIVEQTKNDPYVQSNELGKVKAEFVKKQYRKDIKLDEG